jgi:hypothetical protein
VLSDIRCRCSPRRVDSVRSKLTLTDEASALELATKDDWRRWHTDTA